MGLLCDHWFINPTLPLSHDFCLLYPPRQAHFLDFFSPPLPCTSGSATVHYNIVISRHSSYGWSLAFLVWLASKSHDSSPYLCCFHCQFLMYLWLLWYSVIRTHRNDGQDYKHTIKVALKKEHSFKSGFKVVQISSELVFCWQEGDFTSVWSFASLLSLASVNKKADCLDWYTCHLQFTDVNQIWGYWSSVYFLNSYLLVSFGAAGKWSRQVQLSSDDEILSNTLLSLFWLSFPLFFSPVGMSFSHDTSGSLQLLVLGGSV